MAGPKLKKLGVEIISLPPGDYMKIRELSHKCWLDWGKKSPMCKEVVDSKIKFAKELGLL